MKMLWSMSHPARDLEEIIDLGLEHPSQWWCEHDDETVGFTDISLGVNILNQLYPNAHYQLDIDNGYNRALVKDFVKK